MRRERLARQLAVERVNGVQGLEREQVHRDRRAVLLEREQVVPVVDDVRVRGATAQALDARVVLRRIPIHGEELPPRFVVR